ncbi:MAG: hypothetical protein P8101_17780 [Candidatus Thiodiazotropha sp.]|jgi:ABC-type spermidine/putrescine transport system permease subunit II
MMRYSIRTHLHLLVAALAIPLVVIVGYSIYSDISHAVHDAELSIRTLTKIVAANTNRTLKASIPVYDTGKIGCVVTSP